MNLSNETIIGVVSSVSADIETIVHHGQLTVVVPQSSLIETLRELRDNPLTTFDMLIDITAIDHNKRGNRYEVVYFLSSISYKARVRIKTPVYEKNPHCPTAVGIWESANWYEREVFDMYGIHFDGHPDLRRFYMPEDFVEPETGEPLFPLRKDFPLMGIPGSLPMPPLPERI